MLFAVEKLEVATEEQERNGSCYVAACVATDKKYRRQGGHRMSISIHHSTLNMPPRTIEKHLRKHVQTGC